MAAEPIPTPEAEESVRDATKRLARALESQDCDKISEFNISSRLVEDEEARCETLTTLFRDREVLGVQELTGGGVVDYEYGDYGITAVLVVEDDGLHHLAYADNLLEGETVDTPPAEEFDDVAEAAFDALVERDCEAFVDVANPRHGRGATEPEAVCAYVDANPLPALVESYPELRPESLGGNSDHALYSVSTPEETLTMVLGRAEDPGDGLSSTYEPLPKKAPEYGFVDLIATDPATAPEG